MKKWVKEKLICPECLEKQIPLDLIIKEEHDDDIITGELGCNSCGAVYAVHNGVAVVLPKKSMPILSDSSGYNSQNMLSAYLWSHFSEFFNGPDATDAYKIWASCFQEKNGCALDIGCSVGRISFELSKTHSRVIGIDTSLPFIASARKILNKKRLEFNMTIEGHITQERSCDLDPDWKYDRVDFIVADAMALPFAENCFSTVTSINILEKVPDPQGHLSSVNTVLQKENAMFMFSDPFSWDESVSAPEKWLGGTLEGKYKGRGIDNIKMLFSGENHIFDPGFSVRKTGSILWKIRKTQNLWEHIHSQFVIGER